MAYLSSDIDNPRTMVITSRISLIEQWKGEFEQMHIDPSKIEFLCINSAYKLDGAKYDLVIVDEAHRTLSSEFSKIYHNITTDKLIALTATRPEDKEQLEFLERICPIVFELTMEEVSEMEKVVSPFVVYNLQVPASKKCSMMYNVFNGKFNSAAITLTKMRSRDIELRESFPTIFDMASFYAKSNDKQDELVKVSKEYWSAMSMRKQAVYSNEAKIAMADRIIKSAPDARK